MSSQEKPRIKMPPGLDDYMVTADKTAKALLGSNNPFVAALRKYDEFFRIDLYEKMPALSSHFSHFLFFNAYMGFLSGTRMALSGHSVAVFPLLRVGLESALYGFLMEADNSLVDVWVSRHENEQKREACRRAFTAKKAIDLLGNKCANLQAFAREAYDTSIDFGAHPNVRSVMNHLIIDEEKYDDMVEVNLAALYDETHHETGRGLAACLDFGYLTAAVIVLSPANADERLIGDLEKLNSIKEECIEIVEAKGSG